MAEERTGRGSPGDEIASRGTERILLGLGWREKVKKRNGETDIRIYFRWRRVFVALMVLVVLAWLACGTALYYYFKISRDYEEVSWLKMLVLPIRLDEHRKEMGNYFIEKGTEEIHAGEVGSGVHKLRIGLARNRTNAAARLLLAQIFAVSIKDQDSAIEILRDGLRYKDEDPLFLEKDYLSTLVFLLQREGRFAEVGPTIDAVWDSVDDPRLRDTLATEAIAADIRAGALSEAYARLKEQNLLDSAEGQYLMGEMYWSVGLEDLALLTLQKAINQRAPLRVYGSFFHKLSEREDWERLLNTSSLHTKINPSEFISWSWYLLALQKTGRTEGVAPVVRQILNRFSGETTYLELLAFASDFGYPEIVEEVLGRMSNPEVARLGKFSLGLAYLRAGEPERTLELLSSSEADSDEGGETVPQVYGLRALALFMTGKPASAESNLKSFLKADGQSESNFLVLSKAFWDEGYQEAAVAILDEAANRYPQNAVFLSRLLDYGAAHLEQPVYAQYLKSLMDSQPPPMQDIQDAAILLASDRFLFVEGREGLYNTLEERLLEMEKLRSLLTTL